MTVHGEKIFVGLSGGVDSAISAALLQRAGAKVTGVFIKGWYPPGLPCTWREDRRDAMRVAAHLAIPFHTLDAGAEYKREVIDSLLAEYRAGRTPNPDAWCNRAVKFGAFWRYARAEGAAAIATGHYRAGEKDQSYFLWAVPKEVLSRALFPVGRMEKSTVRALARRYGLPVAKKPDSHGICFLGPVSVEDFLRGELGEAPGRVLDEAGREVGAHRGIFFYTIGERVPLEGGPWFVRAKHVEANELVVARRSAGSPAGAEIFFTDANWLADPAAVRTAHYRYRSARIRGAVEGAHFRAAAPLAEAPAPGQSLVFYDAQGELAGGGVIA